ncbi:hypothetical protein Phum_PHUM507130 [Pediculus humanus corporis]|uniref:Uncharacterized protein n=1 Tax=Pediculus humanus subsp. corporis TaxID=121224 RepID=E0VY03_PEDHC|nr:uncharacterized protein Phum_PHUM507130 [Pediculus humanus corporis]EEB18259.1 hypothetical protein Phum_PHUM507130 [Pediculus humanus corporis]
MAALTHRQILTVLKGKVKLSVCYRVLHRSCFSQNLKLPKKVPSGKPKILQIKHKLSRE